MTSLGCDPTKSAAGLEKRPVWLLCVRADSDETHALVQSFSTFGGTAVRDSPPPPWFPSSSSYVQECTLWGNVEKPQNVAHSKSAVSIAR